MSLRDLQFGLTLRTAKDLSLFHLVFVHVNFCGTFWAAEHGSTLRSELFRRISEGLRPRHQAYYIPWRKKSTPTLPRLPRVYPIRSEEGKISHGPRISGAPRRRCRWSGDRWRQNLTNSPRERAFTRAVVDSRWHLGTWRIPRRGRGSRTTGRDRSRGARAGPDRGLRQNI